MIPSLVRLSARVAVVGSLSLAVAGLSTGCSSTGESGKADALTANVGKYPAAPSSAVKPRVGIPSFKVTTGQGFSSAGDLNGLAADQATTLLVYSNRFDVIERNKLDKMLDEQNLEGIVKPGEMAKAGQVRGIDYMLVGNVTNLRMKTENKSTGFGLAQVGSLFGGADVKKKNVIITTECGVDIRLIDPTNGSVVWAATRDYQKTDTAGAMGVDILGASAEADADIKISDDDRGKVLRLALDEAIRARLPELDAFLASGRAKHEGGAAAAPAAKPVETPAAVVPTPAVVTPAIEAPKTGAVTAKKFCPECGKEVAAGAKFCPADGTKIPQ